MGDPPPSPTRTRRRRMLFVGKLAVSLSLLTFMLLRADVGDVWATFASASVWPLAAAALTPLLGYWLISLRWRSLLAAAGWAVGLAPLYRASMIAMFYNQLLPSTVGGDVARIFEAHRAGVPRATALSSLVVDRVTGIVALAVLAAITLPLVSAYPGRPIVLYGLVWGSAICLLLSIGMIFSPHPQLLALARSVYTRLPGPLSKTARKLDQSVEGYRGRVAVFVAAFAVSMVLQLNVVLMHWLVALGLGIEVSFVSLLLVVPLALMVMLAPITINGIGIREGIFTVLLAAYGVSEPQAVALALMVYAIFLVHGAVGGLIVVGRPMVGLAEQARRSAEVSASDDRPEPTGAGSRARPVASSKPLLAARAPAQTASGDTLRSPTDTP